MYKRQPYSDPGEIVSREQRPATQWSGRGNRTGVRYRTTLPSVRPSKHYTLEALEVHKSSIHPSIVPPTIWRSSMRAFTPAAISFLSCGVSGQGYRDARKLERKTTTTTTTTAKHVKEEGRDGEPFEERREDERPLTPRRSS